MKIIITRSFAAGRDEDGELITYANGEVADEPDKTANKWIRWGWAVPFQKPQDTEIQKAVKDEVQENSSASNSANKPKRGKRPSKSNRKR